MNGRTFDGVMEMKEHFMVVSMILVLSLSPMTRVYDWVLWRSFFSMEIEGNGTVSIFVVMFGGQQVHDWRWLLVESMREEERERERTSQSC